MSRVVHVFSGKFATRAEALEYSGEHWQPEPDSSASDEEYRAWEDRNPVWALSEDLGLEYLDSDFVETIFGPDRIDYLLRMLTSAASRSSLADSLASSGNTLVLVFDTAFGGFPASPASTPTLHYHGAHPCTSPS